MEGPTEDPDDGPSGGALRPDDAPLVGVPVMLVTMAVPQVADAVIHVEPADHPPPLDRHHNHGFDALSYGRSRDRDARSGVDRSS